MKFLVSFQQKLISVFQLSKFSTPTQKSFPSFPVKDSQAAISVVVSIVVGVHGEAQLPIALEQVIALSDSNTNSFCEHLCESENLTNERPSQMSIKHHQIMIFLVQTKTGQKYQTYKDTSLPSPLYLKIVQERHHDHFDGKHNQVGKAGLYTGHQAIAEDYAPAYGMDTRSALLAMTKTIMNIDMNMIN